VTENFILSKNKIADHGQIKICRWTFKNLTKKVQLKFYFWGPQTRLNKVRIPKSDIDILPSEFRIRTRAAVYGPVKSAQFGATCQRPKCDDSRIDPKKVSAPEIFFIETDFKNCQIDLIVGQHPSPDEFDSRKVQRPDRTPPASPIAGLNFFLTDRDRLKIFWKTTSL